jgi:hypothetical protein
MKQFLPVLSVLLLPCFAISQTDSLSPIFIVQRYDTANNRYAVQLSRPLFCTNDGKTGIVLEPLFTRTRTGQLNYRSVQCQLVGIGDCNGSNRLVLYFDGGGRLVLQSTPPANCKGNAWFDREGLLLEKLARPVIRLRFVSGRQYKSFRYEIPETDRDYFQNVYEAWKKTRIRATRKTIASSK